MSTYRVLSSNSRIVGGDGLGAGQKFKRLGSTIAAWPVHLAAPGADVTLCDLDATELGEFDHNPDRVARRDRCGACYGARG